ncbi:MAG: tRNA (guanosine(37)-N1)-methyltransferase TrmD [Deltaproteobacteria bacterium]|nr:tRNA (guanosine(37)-N1)-methyltransferase TrmD [Deltaproteobacteria bacterium]MBI3296270.1 tRNA (guanosine(37)-N1)-methyltransferase TrmD [Deltaproteobacteria bacterium]
MRLHFITLFPELITPWLSSSIIGRAHTRGVFSFECHQLRDYATNRHRTVDDVAYGGGGGMVLKVEPLVRAVIAIRSREPQARTICFAPQGEPLSLSQIEQNKGAPSLILVCGHYEGIDQRFIDGWVDQVICVADVIVTGGELPALIFADSMIRHCDGSLAEGRATNESFSLQDQGRQLLEYPHYTRPSVFEGQPVPEVLLSGDHAAVDRWRREHSVDITRRLRPDLLQIDKELNPSG